jgi:hypothetical protein
VDCDLWYWAGFRDSAAVAIMSKKVSVMRDSNLWLIFEIKVWRKGGGCSGKDSKNARASDQWDWPQSGSKIDSCTTSKLILLRVSKWNFFTWDASVLLVANTRLSQSRHRNILLTSRSAFDNLCNSWPWAKQRWPRTMECQDQPVQSAPFFDRGQAEKGQKWLGFRKTLLCQ